MRSPKVSLLGGLFAHQPFRARVARRVLELVPDARIVEPRYDPAAGALLLAYREIGRGDPGVVGMSLLDALRGGLIVSVQAWRGSAIDDPQIIAAMSRCAQEGGAVAVRIEGEANLRAVRARVALPMIGLIKREYPGFEPYITPSLAEVARRDRFGRRNRRLRRHRAPPAPMAAG